MDEQDAPDPAAGAADAADSRVRGSLVTADPADHRVIDPWDDEWDAYLGLDDGCRADTDSPHGGFAPEDVHRASMCELEAAAWRARQGAADQWRVIDEVLSSAHADPDPWVGPDPTRDPDWRDSRRRTTAAVRRERRELAVRAAAADIAGRLQLSEMTVRTRGTYAQTLRRRCPRVWAAFLGGAMPEQNATAVAQQAGSLPEDDVDALSPADADTDTDTGAGAGTATDTETGADILTDTGSGTDAGPSTRAGGAIRRFEDAVLRPAQTLPPSRFRDVVRVERERAHAESIAARHARAAEDRGAWLTPEADGMCTFTAILPAADGYALMRRIESAARRLRAAEGEERTLAQLRADVLCDLVPAEGRGAAATVAVTVPALSLLGADDEPASLDGYGPIDLDTARRLAGEATSWVRILTHPVSGTVLDVDRTTYRVPADLARWLGVKHPLCVFPGCRRIAADCDLDHILDWQFGGTTAEDNLAPLCRPHHRLKHETRWTFRRHRLDELQWTSPTGWENDPDPPPF